MIARTPVKWDIWAPILLRAGFIGLKDIKDKRSLFLYCNYGTQNGSSLDPIGGFREQPIKVNQKNMVLFSTSGSLSSA